MTEPTEQTERRLGRALPYLRALFLLAVLIFAWLGLRGRGAEIVDAVRDVPLAGVLGALAAVLLGLGATGWLWLRTVAGYGTALAVRPGLATFFLGQLGKYIPGSVWSLGAQADLARGQGVPPRRTVAAGLVFLGYHLATGAVLGAVVLLAGGLDSPWPAWVSVVVLVGALAGLTPAVVRALGTRVGGSPFAASWRSTAVAVVLMAAAWTAYSVALVLLTPSTAWSQVVPLGAAFALAYAVGVVVVVAPAGLGAREGLFIALLSPLLGVAEATALALLARLVHTGADGGLAGAAWWVARSRVRGAFTATTSGGPSPARTGREPVDVRTTR